VLLPCRRIWTRSGVRRSGICRRAAAVEDAAQAIGEGYKGRRPATWRRAAFSFYPTKNLGAVRDRGHDRSQLGEQRADACRICETNGRPRVSQQRARGKRRLMRSKRTFCAMKHAPSSCMDRTPASARARIQRGTSATNPASCENSPGCYEHVVPVHRSRGRARQACSAVLSAEKNRPAPYIIRTPLHLSTFTPSLRTKREISSIPEMPRRSLALHMYTRVRPAQ